MRRNYDNTDMFILAVWSKNLYHSDAMLTLIKLYHCFSKSADSSHRVLIIHSPEGTLCVFKPVLAIYKQDQTNNTFWKNKQTNKQHASQTTQVPPVRMEMHTVGQMYLSWKIKNFKILLMNSLPFAYFWKVFSWNL